MKDFIIFIFRLLKYFFLRREGKIKKLFIAPQLINSQRLIVLLLSASVALFYNLSLIDFIFIIIFLYIAYLQAKADGRYTMISLAYALIIGILSKFKIYFLLLYPIFFLYLMIYSKDFSSLKNRKKFLLYEILKLIIVMIYLIL